MGPLPLHKNGMISNPSTASCPNVSHFSGANRKVSRATNATGFLLLDLLWIWICHMSRPAMGPLPLQFDCCYIKIFMLFASSGVTHASMAQPI